MEPISKYNLNIVRDVYLHGESSHVGMLKKLLSSLYFLNPRVGIDLNDHRSDTYFVLAALDLDDKMKCQVLARVFSAMTSPLVERLVFVVKPTEPTREQLLFLQELGVRYAAFGLSKNEEIKEQIKRICVEGTQETMTFALRTDLETALKQNDQGLIRKVMQKLGELPNQGEEVLRLTAIASMRVAENRKSESCLRRILGLNSQNLWAANELGKFYIRSGRAGEGVEVLERLSRFHSLSCERLLVLGDAYANAGMAREAEAKYKQSEELTGGQDERVTAGLAKVKLLDHDAEGALYLLASKAFSPDLISFLNMRAIMSIRSNEFDEGVKYYLDAVLGAGDSREVVAKLKFNLGLAYARSGDLDHAQQCFLESVALGGKAFSRAKKPLSIVQSLLKNREQGKSVAKGLGEMIDDVSEWETLY